MSTATAAPMQLDISSAPHRSRWPGWPRSSSARRSTPGPAAGSIIGILGLVVVIEVIYAFAANDGDKDLQDFIQIPGAVLGYFLPIIIIMLVTSESSQRNGLVTFTLEPRRSRVVVAKFIAGIAPRRSA